MQVVENSSHHLKSLKVCPSHCAAFWHACLKRSLPKSCTTSWANRQAFQVALSNVENLHFLKLVCMIVLCRAQVFVRCLFLHSVAHVTSCTPALPPLQACQQIALQFGQTGRCKCNNLIKLLNLALPWRLCTSAQDYIHATIEGWLMQGQYDRVHVGASCPPDRLAALLPLLRPQGGIIVTPVSPNDLRMIKVNAEGDVMQKVISQVRYSELEVLRPTPCTQCCNI